MAKHLERTLGQMIRQRRRELGWTQREIALRAGTSVPYIGHLEAGKRHPSERVLLRLSNILRAGPARLILDRESDRGGLVKPAKVLNGGFALGALQADRNIQRIHNNSTDEIKLLSRVAVLGESKRCAT